MSVYQRRLLSKSKQALSGLSYMKTGVHTAKPLITALSVAEEYDVQVAIHTDTLNESGYLDSTLGAFKDRCIHTFHTEGAGGGHAPDILKAIGETNVLPSSTNPTALLLLIPLTSISTCLWFVTT